MTHTPDPVIPDRDSVEPALTVGAITAVVGAALALAIAFGFDLSTTQTAAILGFTTALAPLVSAWFTRSRVYAPATVAQMQDEHASELADASARNRWPSNEPREH